MEIKTRHILLAGIFFLALALRLFFAFQTPYYNYDAYFSIQQVEHIMQTGLPDFNPNSTPNENYFLPLFHYILAFFSLFLPGIVVFKVLPNVFAVSLVFVVYLIVKELTKSKEASIFAAFLAGFMPIFIFETTNAVSVYSLVVPLSFFLIYCYLKINIDFIYLIAFIVVVFLLTITHASILFLVIGLLFYIALAKLESIPHSRTETELILFSTIFITWLIFLIFKKPLLVHGLSVVWQNIPQAMLNNYFTNFNILEAIYKIGILPFLFGTYVVFRYVLRERRKSIYLFISFALALFLILWLKLIKLDIGLIFLGTLLIILFSQSFKLVLIYFKKTHLAKYHTWLILVFFLIAIITSVIPSITYASSSISNTPSKYEIDAVLWLKDNSEPNAVVLAPVQEGFLINAVANRRNAIDYNFLAISDSEQRFQDVLLIYTDLYETDAVPLLNKYDVNYILFSDVAKHEFNIQKISYVNDERCFRLVYDQNVQIYKSLCVVEEK